MMDITLPRMLSRLVILLMAFTIHELAHAWTADWFGDDTPRRYGRLTLNPLAHLDPLGALMFLAVGFGWAKPVPINPHALARRSYYTPMWVALAGPVSNLALALLAAIPFQLGVFGPTLTTGRFFPTPAEFAWEFVFLNLVLFVFNLIPIAPLDGEKVLYYLAPRSWAATLDRIRPYGPLILLAVIFLGPMFRLDILGWIVWRPTQALLALLV